MTEEKVWTTDYPRICRSCPSPLAAGRSNYCVECVTNGRRQRDSELRQRYGPFGLLAYEEMLRAQDGRCANPLCVNEPNTVDHDHSCCPGRQTTCGQCVRYLLCGPCNLAEGHLKTARRARGLALLMDRGL